MYTTCQNCLSPCRVMQWTDKHNVHWHELIEEHTNAIISTATVSKPKHQHCVVRCTLVSYVHHTLELYFINTYAQSTLSQCLAYSYNNSLNKTGICIHMYISRYSDTDILSTALEEKGDKNKVSKIYVDFYSALFQTASNALPLTVVWRRSPLY